MNRPVRVKWINDLVDADGKYLPHLLPVDPTLHWANPPGGNSGPGHAADLRPTRPAPTRVRSRSSRTCTAPSASATRATATRRRGTCRRPRTSRPATPGRAPGTTSSQPRPPAPSASAWGPGFAVFQYPNENRASTIWYHDHALGMTRLNVYAGPAGFYLIRGGPAGDEAVLDSRGPAPALCSRARRHGRTTRSRPTRPTTRSRSRSRTARSTTTGRCSTRTRRVFFDGIVRDLHPGRGVLADLESRVLRQHDHGQRQHLAVPDRRAAPLPLPLPQRLPVALPDPRLQQHPRRRGLADRQRGRLPRRPGEPHRRPTATGC